MCPGKSPRQLIKVKEERKADGVLLQDSGYIRRGIAKIYITFEPLVGRRHMANTWVKVVASLSDNQYKDRSRITLVEDNLTPHRPCTFYEVYTPRVAKACLDRIEFVFTP